MVKHAGIAEYFMEEMQRPDVPDYVGRYMSAWGHPNTILAAANPEIIVGDSQTKTGDYELLQQKRSGFGMVRVNTSERKITIECYPILATMHPVMTSIRVGT